MDNKLVSIIQCDEYDQSVYGAVEKALLEAGVTKVMLDGKKVFIKANLVLKIEPEKCATTHPVVIEAIARFVKNFGGHPVIGDSPGGTLWESRLGAVYKVTGMAWAAEKSGAELNYNLNQVKAANRKAKVLKSMELLEAVATADVVISAAKLKSHGMTGFSGAVKNMYGCIPGLTKVEYHYRMSTLTAFSDMLVDLCEHVHPQISLIDGIWGMEGEGPTSGDPKHIGAVIASLNPHAADAAAIKLVNFDPGEICTIQRAVERGLLAADFSDVTVNGDTVNCKDFNMLIAKNERVNTFTAILPGFLRKRAENWLTPKPVFIKNRCRLCGECAKVCPQHAISMEKDIPEINFSRCIKCFCCHELCPFHAVRTKRPKIHF